MINDSYKDWGEVSSILDDIMFLSKGRELINASEAQTRFDVIDRLIREVLQWKHGTIHVEEYDDNPVDPERIGYVDYILKSGDYKIIVEAKKIGSAFPFFTRKKQLKLTGSILGSGPINQALIQAERYAQSKSADVVCVTNGKCWCLYGYSENSDRNLIYATILFPLDSSQDAEQLFKYLALPQVENGSLGSLSNEDLTPNYHRLLNVVKDSSTRIGRNNLADYVNVAIEQAFHGDSIIGDEGKLEYCFVSTDSRTKYDNTLNVFISDRKSDLLTPARRVKKGSKAEDEFYTTIKSHDSGKGVPVTLLLGSVGSGKSTYLSHFELIYGREILKEKKVFWAYIDFEKMGKEGSPRAFIYRSLLDMLLVEHEYIPTDLLGLIQPAYDEEIRALARGPFGLAAKNKVLFEQKIQERIENEYNAIEPYVDRIYSYLSKTYTCIIVLDNIDLYEDSGLEITVFSEGVALSKKLTASVMVSIRDTTYIKHKNESIFNAFELRKFWIDPPPFREVLSKRLSYGSMILKNQKAKINYNNLSLYIKDLSVFFEIAHSSLLNEKSAKFIESIADGDIRKGITLVANFLSSAHIEADRAVYNYLQRDHQVVKELPFHEVFKGCVLGPWKYYQEDRAEVINIVNSGYNSKALQLLRAYILKQLQYRAMDKNTMSTSVQSICDLFYGMGAASSQILDCLNVLRSNHLLTVNDGHIVSMDSHVSITIAGAYYVGYLINQFPYLEEVMFDTMIFSAEHWNIIHETTGLIEAEPRKAARIKFRIDRVNQFKAYLEEIELHTLKELGLEDLSIVKGIDKYLPNQLEMILKSATRNYS